MPQPRGSAKLPVFAMKKNVWRAMIEAGLIIFLSYSNLLMGEFEIWIAVSITSGWPVTHALKSSEMNASETAFAGVIGMVLRGLTLICA